MCGFLCRDCVLLFGVSVCYFDINFDSGWLRLIWLVGGCYMCVLVCGFSRVFGSFYCLLLLVCSVMVDFVEGVLISCSGGMLTCEVGL